ncbi:MAG: flagellar motor switch protein FliG, partial [Gammaproteobacteria bacterium]|nr:flagellar motor switch protein FliG [Gammaproteobacteria bacterium]
MADEKIEDKKDAKPEFDVSTLTGLQKTAFLLLSLKEEDAASILKSLQPKEVQYVGQA